MKTTKHPIKKMLKIIENKYIYLSIGFFKIILSIRSYGSKCGNPFYFGFYSNRYFSILGIKKYWSFRFIFWPLRINRVKKFLLKNELNEKEISLYLRKQTLKERIKTLYKWGSFDYSGHMGKCYAGLCGHKCIGCKIEHDCIDSHATYGYLNYSSRNFPNCEESFI